jgi:hypothetical protein
MNNEQGGWTIVVFAAVDFRPPALRYMALAFDAEDAPLPAMQFGPTPSVVRERLEMALLRERARGRDPLRVHAPRLDDQLGLKVMKRVRTPTMAKAGDPPMQQGGKREQKGKYA